MELGRGGLDGATEMHIEAPVDSGSESRLNAHFGRAEITRFDGAAHDFVFTQEVGFFGTMLRGRTRRTRRPSRRHWVKLTFRLTT